MIPVRCCAPRRTAGGCGRSDSPRPASIETCSDSKLETGESILSPSGVADPTTPGVNVYWWQSPDIKVDAYPYYPVDALFDGVEFDGATADNVVRNDTAHPNANRLYVQAHNRGPLPAHNVKVKVLWADASGGAARVGCRLLDPVPERLDSRE